jgi:hypothetical protein
MKPLALLMLALAVNPASAQFGTAGAPPTMPGWSGGPGTFGHALRSGRALPDSHSNVVFLGEPWLDSYPPQSGQPTYIVLQPQAPPSLKPAEEPKPVTPLLIEWQGDRFVRLGADLSGDQVNAGHNSPVVKSSDSAPVTLIYRDGHREQIRDYSIIGGHLYTSAEYFQSGSWTKTISLSALNLPATIAANHEAGVCFALPTAANVVMTRF